jgi:hypothetical protein
MAQGKKRATARKRKSIARSKTRKTSSVRRTTAKKSGAKATPKKRRAKLKPKHAAKKIARKQARTKKPRGHGTIETVTVDVIEETAPDVITVTEFEETEVREEDEGPEHQKNDRTAAQECLSKKAASE